MNDIIRRTGNGRAPQIKFGEGFDEWPTGKQISYLKELASSMNNAADKMQTERNEMSGKLALAEDKLANAQNALDIQKTIVMNHITTANIERQSFIAEIQALQARVRELSKRHGNNN